jgi:hypothetical protein
LWIQMLAGSRPATLRDLLVATDESQGVATNFSGVLSVADGSLRAADRLL